MHVVFPTVLSHLFHVKHIVLCFYTSLALPSEQWKPINPEEKKRYDREFLLGFQFISASMNKPEGLPIISDVVLDKVGYVLHNSAIEYYVTVVCNIQHLLCWNFNL